MTEELGMDEILGQSPEAKPGTVVEGVVVGRIDPHLVINVGLKQEALLSLNEFGGSIPQVGEKISVLIIRTSGPEGRPMVSWKQARERLNWDTISALHQKAEIVEGKITRRVKGGVQVDIGLDAFMPASQMDDRPVAKPEEWVGRSVRVLIIEMDRAKGNVLVSRRRVQEQEKSVKKTETLAKLEIGQVLKGRVTGLTNFGAFVDIGGIEGLLHVSDMAWARIDDPKKVVKVGDELDVKILKYDAATQRISLGRKQLLAHPWEGIETRFPTGTKVTGKITGIAPFGAFMEIEPGVEGLIHISELSWTENIKNPKDVLKEGEEVSAVVIGVDREKGKISLSLKRTGTNPWEEISRQYPVGSQIEGEVTHIASFGAFLKLAPGVEGLLKQQDMSWTDKAKAAIKVGDKLKVVVLGVNLQEEKIALGLKQLTADPMREVRAGQVVNGTVVKVTDFGMFLKLESGVEGLVRSSEMQLRRSIFSDPNERYEKGAPKESPYKEGDVVQAVVTKINKKERKLELSVRRFEADQEKELLQKYSGSTSNPTLGEATGWSDDL